MEITKLTLGSLASNCYIQSVENGQCVIVDIGEGAPVLLRHLEQMHLKPVAILLTHGHYDHIAGVEQVRETWNIPVYIHKMDAAMLTDSRLNLGDWLSDLPFQPVKAWETVEEGDHLTFAGCVKICCTPETRCSACHGDGRISPAEATVRCWIPSAS